MSIGTVRKGLQQVFIADESHQEYRRTVNLLSGAAKISEDGERPFFTMFTISLSIITYWPCRFYVGSVYSIVMRLIIERTPTQTNNNNNDNNNIRHDHDANYSFVPSPPFL